MIRRRRSEKLRAPTGRASAFNVLAENSLPRRPRENRRKEGQAKAPPLIGHGPGAGPTGQAARAARRRLYRGGTESSANGAGDGAGGGAGSAGTRGDDPATETVGPTRARRKTALVSPGSVGRAGGVRMRTPGRKKSRGETDLLALMPPHPLPAASISTGKKPRIRFMNGVSSSASSVSSRRSIRRNWDGSQH